MLFHLPVKAWKLKFSRKSPHQHYLKRVTVHRHLALMLSSNLDWSNQIQYDCFKTNRKLAVLRNIRFIQRHTLNLLYKITVRFIIDYCLPMYPNCIPMAHIESFRKKSPQANPTQIGKTSDWGFKITKQRAP